jgi:hypothetical protein
VLVTFWSLGPVGVVTMRAWPVFGRGSWPVAASPYGPARGPLPRAKPMPGRVSRLVLLLAGQASPSRRGALREKSSQRLASFGRRGALLVARFGCGVELPRVPVSCRGKAEDPGHSRDGISLCLGDSG